MMMMMCLPDNKAAYLLNSPSELSEMKIIPHVGLSTGRVGLWAGDSRKNNIIISVETDNILADGLICSRMSHQSTNIWLVQTL